MAIVTGASAGIGSAICKDLCKHHIKVVGLARRLDRLEQLQKEILEANPSAQFYPVKCDLTSEEDIAAAFAYVIDTHGGVDILVNNAGVAEYKSVLEDLDLEQIHRIIDTNFVATVSCIKKAHQSMVKRNGYGYIINISSVLGHFVRNIPGSKPIMNVYGPMKYALTALNQVIRSELFYNKQDKIRISNISPGAVKTEIYQAGGLNTESKAFGGNLAFMDPEDVSDVVVYFLGTKPTVQVEDILIRNVKAF